VISVDLFEGGKIALRSLGTNRLRTLLTTGGIAIGVATLLAIVGIIQGLNASFEKQLATMGTNSVYIAKRKFGGGSDSWQEARQRKDVTTDQMNAVKSECTYCTAVAPNLVASVTSVAGPNQGAALADALNGTLPAGSLSRTVVATVVNGFASLIGLISGNNASQNSSAALNSLSSAGMARFNAAHPEGLPTSSCGQGPAVASNGVRYYSWSGAQPFTNALDPLDAGLAVVSVVHGGAKNDGLVGSCSSHLGTVLRDDYGMNHLDEVNQTAGIVNWFEVDPKSVFRNQANRLKNLGL